MPGRVERAEDALTALRRRIHDRVAARFDERVQTRRMAELIERV